MRPDEVRNRIKDTSIKLNTSAVSVTLCVLLVSVLGFDILLGVHLADYAILAATALALIAWLFYRSRGKSWNKTA